MKYLFFRDLEHDGNLKDGKTHHSAGLIYGKHFDIEPNFSGKDYAVTYFDPFEGELVNIWRSAKEIEVFEVDRWEWESLDKIHKLIQKI